MNTKKLQPAHNGFSLIEVMIALLVLALGILAISKLQGTLIRSGSDANKRSVAASLAQKKIDDLKSFSTLKADVNNDGVPDSWTSAATWPLTQQSYEFIDDDEGGIIAPGAYSFGELDYQLNWVVNPYFYNEGVSNPASTAAATVVSRFKDVTVTVAWQDETGETSSVELSTVIDAYSAINTGNDTTNTGGNSPIIPYTPKLAPDVIPVSLDTDDGLKKETAKPLPDVSKKGASTSTQFSTVTYNTLLDTVRREDFKTVACLCTSAGASPTTLIKKGKTIWDSENLKLADVAVEESVPTISKTKVDNSSGELQDIDCDVCCRDSADNVSGGNYKACRLKRIDGIYRLYDPWKMIAFNIIPASYFDANATLPGDDMTAIIAQNNIDTYSDYVTNLVRQRLKLNEVSFNTSGVVTNFAPDNFEGADSILHRTFNVGIGNNRQLQARAVFMDYPPIGIYTSCESCASPTMGLTKEDVVPLDRVPFTEVNLTQLAGWNPDRNDIVFPINYAANPTGSGGHDNVGNSPSCLPDSAPIGRNYVTNDAIENGCETKISRGMFYPTTITPILSPLSVQTRIYTSNDGVVDRKVYNSASSATATINLKVVP